MTPELLHDALTLLPTDLIAAADKVRYAAPKPAIRWSHLAAMAACTVLILCCGLMVLRPGIPKEAMTEECAEAPAAEQEAASGENGSYDDAAAPAPESAIEEAAPEAAPLLPDTGENKTVSGTSRNTLTLHTPLLPGAASRSAQPEAVMITSQEALEDYFASQESCYDLQLLRSVCSSYGEEWFTHNDLLLFRLPRTADPVPGSLNQGDDGWTMQIGILPENGDTLSCWHIAMPVEKNRIDPAEPIQILFEDLTPLP